MTGGPSGRYGQFPTYAATSFSRLAWCLTELSSSLLQLGPGTRPRRPDLRGPVLGTPCPVTDRQGGDGARGVCAGGGAVRLAAMSKGQRLAKLRGPWEGTQAWARDGEDLA